MIMSLEVRDVTMCKGFSPSRTVEKFLIVYGSWLTLSQEKDFSSQTVVYKVKQNIIPPLSTEKCLIQ